MTPRRSVSASRTINAPASAIFNLLADPRQHARLDGSGAVVDVKDAPERLSLGAVFTMRMKMKANYTTRNVVSEFVENKSIAWHHKSGFIWRYELDDVEGGTKVTESFTYDNPLGLIISMTSIPKKNQEAMKVTLLCLEQAVTP
ncbi:MAG TPA: SRPBCC family protein [Acidimicrobiales bacterium]